VSTAPDCWTSTTIGEVTLPVDKHRPEDEPTQEFRYVDISSIDNRRNRVVEPKLVLGRDAPSRARQVVRAGDTVLSTVRTYLKNTAIVPADLDGATASTGFSVLRPDPNRVDPRFLFYRVLEQGFVESLSEKQTGTSYPAVRDRDVRAMAFSYPPLDEQRWIVEVIEEQFSRLDAGAASLQRTNRNVARLHASILAAAAHGKLDTPTGEFRGDGEHWRRTTLGELLISIEAGKSFRVLTRPAAEDEWGVIKVSAMTWGSFREDENKALPTGMRFDPDFEIAEGDLLLSRANTSEYVGATVLVPATRPRLLLSDKSMRLHVREGVNKRWLWYTLLAPPLRSQMSAVATGTSDSMRNISQAKVRGLSIKVPPLDIQIAVVMEVDRRLSVIDALEVAVENALTRSDTLRNSVLRAAFSGNLQEARR